MDSRAATLHTLFACVWRRQLYFHSMVFGMVLFGSALPAIAGVAPSVTSVAFSALSLSTNPADTSHPKELACFANILRSAPPNARYIVFYSLFIVWVTSCLPKE